MMILLLSLVNNLKPFFVLILFLFFWFMSIIIIFIFHFIWLVGYYTWTALPLLVISMFFMHVVILLKVWYVISDKHKYISFVVVVVVIPEVGRKGEWGGGWLRTPLWKKPWNFSCFYFTYHCKFQTKQSAKLHPWKFQKIVLDPLEIPGQKPGPLEIPHYFFSWSPLEIPYLVFN